MHLFLVTFEEGLREHPRLLKHWDQGCHHVSRLQVEELNSHRSILRHAHLYFSKLIEFGALLSHIFINLRGLYQVPVIYPALYTL